MVYYTVINLYSALSAVKVIIHSVSPPLLLVLSLPLLLISPSSSFSPHHLLLSSPPGHWHVCLAVVGKKG